MVSLSSPVDAQVVSGEELALRIRAGDRAAEALLVEKYQIGIFEMLRNRTQDSELSRDLLQDTLQIIILRLRESGIHDPSKLAGFVHRVAHNLMIAHYRKEARRQTSADSELVELVIGSEFGQLQVLLRAEEADVVQQLLRELPIARDREILLRFYVWEQTKPSVCHAMELAEDNFDRVVSRARQRFRALLEDRLEKHELAPLKESTF